MKENSDHMKDMDQLFDDLYEMFSDKDNESLSTFLAVISLSDAVYVDRKFSKPAGTFSNYNYLVKSGKDYSFIRPSFRNLKKINKQLKENKKVLIIYKSGFFFDRFIKKLPVANLSRHYIMNFFTCTLPAPSLVHIVKEVTTRIKKKFNETQNNQK